MKSIRWSFAAMLLLSVTAMLPAQSKLPRGLPAQGSERPMHFVGFPLDPFALPDQRACGEECEMPRLECRTPRSRSAANWREEITHDCLKHWQTLLRNGRLDEAEQLVQMMIHLAPEAAQVRAAETVTSMARTIALRQAAIQTGLFTPSRPVMPQVLPPIEEPRATMPEALEMPNVLLPIPGLPIGPILPMQPLLTQMKIKDCCRQNWQREVCEESDVTPAAVTSAAAMPRAEEARAAHVHLVTPHFEAHCERLSSCPGSPDRVVLEGDVRVTSKRAGQTMRIEAARVLVNMKDGSVVVEASGAPEPTQPTSVVPPRSLRILPVPRGLTD